MAKILLNFSTSELVVSALANKGRSGRNHTSD
uniref:Uncharacterized protein n=1 Tax=Arundo donax TaxID=35708 RepID=A0A0A9BRG2_ARUDO